MDNFRKYNYIDSIRNQYITFPSWLEYLDVTPTTKLVYIYILDRHQLSIKNNWIDKNNNIYCYFTINTLTKKINVSERTIKNSINELRDKSLLHTEKQRNGVNRIYILEPTDEYLENLMKSIEDDEDEFENYTDENFLSYPQKENKNSEIKSYPQKINNNYSQNKVINNDKTTKNTPSAKSALANIQEYSNNTLEHPLQMAKNTPSAKSALAQVQNLPLSHLNIIMKDNIYIHSEEKIKKMEQEDPGMYNRIISYLTIINKYIDSGMKLKNKNITKDDMNYLIKNIKLEDLEELDFRLTRISNIKSIDKYVITSILDIIHTKQYNKQLKDNYNDEAQLISEINRQKKYIEWLNPLYTKYKNKGKGFEKFANDFKKNLDNAKVNLKKLENRLNSLKNNGENYEEKN